MPKSRFRDSAKYAPLAAAYASDDIQQGTRLNHDDVGGYRTKTVRAGDWLYVSMYPLIGINTDREQKKRLQEFEDERAKKAKLRLKYARYNNKRRMTEFEQMVHANITKGDLHVCCTYDQQDYRDYDNLIFRSREDAKRDIRNYIRRVRHMLKKNGVDLNQFRWICVTVTKESVKEAARPLPDRHHHHLLFHGVPEYLRDDVENLWREGYCNADRLREDSEGFARVANYVARQEGSFNGENSGEKSFTTSRNIIKPTITTSDSKISRRRAAMIAADVRSFGAEIFGKLFPEYRITEEPVVNTSVFVAGAYIYARLRRIPYRRK